MERCEKPETAEKIYLLRTSSGTFLTFENWGYPAECQARIALAESESLSHSATVIPAYLHEFSGTVDTGNDVWHY